MGLLACISLIIYVVLYIVLDAPGFLTGLLAGTPGNWRAITVFLFAAPMSIYCSKVINQFDQRLQKKQKLVKKEKENLLNCYKGLLSDMDTLLSKSTESASGLAERSFESKRRDFQRFLDRLKLRFPSGGVVKETSAMVDQFRKFVLNWLRVFEECSIDPVANPKQVVTFEELEGLSSIAEIAVFVSDRLTTTEVKFITEQRKNDNDALKDDKENLAKMNQGRNLIAITDGREGKSSDNNQNSSGRGTGSFVQQVGAAANRQCTWFTCGVMGCMLCKPSSNAAEGCPREFTCGCFELIILSRQHLNLVFSFFLGLCTVGLSTYIYLIAVGQEPVNESQERIDIFILVFMVLSLFSLVIILIKFEQIDVVQQLEREVQELQKQNEIVEANRQRMRHFWNQAQQLTELWLYRTVPRLDLCKELHSQLEDTQNDKELLTHMQAANKGLMDIETKLGSLEDWRGDGGIKVEDKKAFGKIINEVCQEQEPDAVIQKIEELVRGREMRNLAIHN